MTEKNDDLQFLKDALQESFYNGNLSINEVIKNHKEIQKIEIIQRDDRRKNKSQNFVYSVTIALLILILLIFILYGIGHIPFTSIKFDLSNIMIKLLVFVVMGGFIWCVKTITAHHHPSSQTKKNTFSSNDESQQLNES